jgi:hypothetical protein
MADIAYRDETIAYAGRRTVWGAIWVGVFTFVAIWSVFGSLGEAIFASAANSNASERLGGMSLGMAIWAIILTIIAMFVAGRVTAHFADMVDRNGRIMHGMAMFGLSVIAVIITVILSGTALSGGPGVAGEAHTSSYMLTVFSDIGWIGFVALFLGWLAAMGGAAHGPSRGVDTSVRNIRDIRPAA